MIRETRLLFGTKLFRQVSLTSSEGKLSETDNILQLNKATVLTEVLDMQSLPETVSDTNSAVLIIKYHFQDSIKIINSSVLTRLERWATVFASFAFRRWVFFSSVSTDDLNLIRIIYEDVSKLAPGCPSEWQSSQSNRSWDARLATCRRKWRDSNLSMRQWRPLWLPHDLKGGQNMVISRRRRKRLLNPDPRRKTGQTQSNSQMKNL